jgi:hypothetical protein
VTRDRLGCYRPEEHIDNPKDYADNLDARQYDRRLRAPVDERRELAIDQRTGLKHYIATEDIGITTSAGLVRELYGKAIELGRRYARSERKEDLYEAFRLLGTANHCLEDYAAHSNYVELALHELGERDVFPHVGRRTQIELPGARQPVFPIITGTFGGVDFLHSVMGELSDKTTQSEIQELEGTISGAENNQADTSLLQDLLNKVPDGLFGGKDEAGKADELKMNAQAAQMQNTHISPREPEEWAQMIDDMFKQIYPIIEWHDEIMLSINEAIEKIPVLPELLEQLTEQINVFVFSLLAPFVLPVIRQVKNELATGSSEIIGSSEKAQHNVFYDDECSDPTHSMLSKDHFSNILNEPAGKVSSQVLKWVVPQIMAAWDDPNIDINRTLNRIISGTFHHPALKEYGEDGARDGRRAMFMVVEQWWSSKDGQEKDYMRDQLSREGVQQGRNHKEGVHDKGHGCGKPLGMPNFKTAGSSGAVGGVPLNILGDIGDALEGKSQYDTGAQGSGGGSSGGKIGNFAGEAVGGGVLGSVVGGLAGSLLGGAFGGDSKKEERQTGSYGREQSYGGGRESYGGRSSGNNENYGKGGGYSGEGETDYTAGGYGGGNQSYGSGNTYSSKGQSYGGSGYSGREESYGRGASGGYGGQQQQPEGYDAPGAFPTEGRTYGESSYEQRSSNFGREEPSYVQESSYEQRRRRSGSHESAQHHKNKSRSRSRGSNNSYRRRRNSNDSNKSGGSDRRRYGASGYGGAESYGGGYSGGDASYGGGAQYGGREERYSGGEGREGGYGGGGGSGGYGGREESYGSREETYGAREETYGGGGGYQEREENYEQQEGYGQRQNYDEDGGNYGYGERRY